MHTEIVPGLQAGTVSTYPGMHTWVPGYPGYLPNTCTIVFSQTVATTTQTVGGLENYPATWFGTNLASLSAYLVCKITCQPELDVPLTHTLKVTH